MDQPVVSIVVPIYNAAAFLPQCIDSLLQQTYPSTEIILVDDGSMDTSLTIAEDYAKRDARVKVIHQENAGVSAARNRGIEATTGLYITFVDSDDELLPDGIQLLVNDILTYNADVATASKLYITADQKEVSRSLGKEGTVTVFSGIESVQLSLDFDRRMTACHGKLFRKAFLADIRFAERRRINEDFFFVFQCCMKQPVFVYRDECVYKYFQRENSASRTSFSEKYFDMLYFAEQKKQMIQETYPELLPKAICMEVSTHLFMLSALCRTTDKKYKKDERESVRFIRHHYKGYTTSNKHEKRLAAVAVLGLFPLYKYAIRLKGKFR